MKDNTPLQKFIEIQKRFQKCMKKNTRTEILSAESQNQKKNSLGF